jgi:hypothetical protein
MRRTAAFFFLHATLTRKANGPAPMRLLRSYACTLTLALGAVACTGTPATASADGGTTGSLCAAQHDWFAAANCPAFDGDQFLARCAGVESQAAGALSRRAREAFGR